MELIEARGGALHSPEVENYRRGGVLHTPEVEHYRRGGVLHTPEFKNCISRRAAGAPRGNHDGFKI
jgi:hypothetical protein